MTVKDGLFQCIADRYKCISGTLSLMEDASIVGRQLQRFQGQFGFENTGFAFDNADCS